MIKKINTYVIRKIYDKLYSQLKPYYFKYQQKKNGDIIALNINSNIGFFAQLNWCLYIFDHCETHNKKPYIILSGHNYINPNKGSDWFDYFFEKPELTNQDKENINNKRVTISNIRNYSHLGIAKDYDSCLTLEYASYLMNKYCRIKKHIIDKVDLFHNDYLKHKNVLGIHYRGTDKISEAPKVAWKTCTDSINGYLKKHREIGSLFVASDEAKFVEFISKEIRSIPVYYHDDHTRSHNGKAIHRSSFGDNYKKGEEALVNSLLLSRCNILIRTSSFLSAWSSVFNPNLPIILLNKPYNETLWFPESAIIKKFGLQYDLPK